MTAIFIKVKWTLGSAGKGRKLVRGCNKQKLIHLTAAEKRGQEGNETVVLHVAVYRIWERLEILSKHVLFPEISRRHHVSVKSFIRIPSFKLFI